MIKDLSVIKVMSTYLKVNCIKEYGILDMLSKLFYIFFIVVISDISLAEDKCIIGNIKIIKFGNEIIEKSKY